MIPSFPKGATLRSLEIASVRCGQQPSLRAATREYGVTTPASRLLLGFRVGRFSEHLLKNSIDGSRLLEDHTFFLLSASLLSQEVQEKWHHALVAGDLSVHKRFLPSGGTAIFSTPYSRLCPNCVEEDLRAHSIAYWRVVHQIFLVTKCPKHGSLLRRYATPEFGSDFRVGTEEFLPHEQPALSFESKGAGTSEIDQIPTFESNSIEETIFRIFEKSAPELRPEVRNATFKWHRSVGGKTSEDIASSFREWCKNARFSRIDKITQSQLRSVFEHGAINNVLLLLVATDFLWKRTPPEIKELIIGQASTYMKSTRAPVTTPSSNIGVEEELTETIDRLHLPREAVAPLLAGSSTYKLIGSIDRLNLNYCLSLNSREFLRAASESSRRP